ncbi:hypothetical protein KF913_10100 [Candidatus Obscuribacterales bacterium]|nr:hypothetical protein [Candidatus Obscuribacterales bacterium]
MEAKLQTDGIVRERLSKMDSKDKTLDEQFAQLSKKVDDQFRFTRTVIVLCTLVNLGLVIFTILATFQSLPSQVNAHYMSNLEPVVRLWHQYERLMESQQR